MVDLQRIPREHDGYAWDSYGPEPQIEINGSSFPQVELSIFVSKRQCRIDTKKQRGKELCRRFAL